MSVALYMDENVHGALTNGLRQRQVDALTVQGDSRTAIKAFQPQSNRFYPGILTH